MSALSIEVPFPVFQDRDGQPLENGYVWLGVANLNPQVNPVIAYFDKALTIPAAQPLRTINGYISNAGTPAQIYVDGASFSILVQDSKGSMVYNFPDGSSISNACNVIYNPPFTGGVAYPVCEKLEQTVSVQDFGAVGDGVTDDTIAFTNAAAANRYVTVPFSASGYNVSSSVVVGSSMFMFLGGFRNAQLVGTATATQLNAISIHVGQISGQQLRLEPPLNTLTGLNEGGKRALFIKQAEPNLASTSYGNGPWYFNQIVTEWNGTRTGTGTEGGPTSATVQGFHVGLDVGGANYNLQSAAAIGAGLIHTIADTSNGDKVGSNVGVSTNATSPGKVYGASSAVTIGTSGYTPQAVGNEVDIFVDNTGIPVVLGFSSWSGGTQQASGTYAAYAIARSGAASAVSWKAGFVLYTAAGTLPQPIVSTGSMFNTDSPTPITLANIMFFPTMVVNGSVLKFPNIDLQGNGIMKLSQGYDFTQSTPPSANSSSKLLRDYEEGLFLATLTPSTSGSITVLNDTSRLSYTKIGNTVFVRGQFNVTSVSSPVGFIKINLPFPVGNLSFGAGNSCGSIVISNVVSANITDFVLQAEESLNYASIYLGNATSIQDTSAQQIQAGTFMKINLSYTVA